jgi:3-phenylpropionate/trans-cinnamate dioxygenase ferredoxin subunit
MLTAEAGFVSAGAADLAPGACVRRTVAGRDLLLARGQDGQFFAVAPLCSHASLPLDGGRVRGTSIICPHHGARFCLKTGRVLGPPAHEGITAYPTRQEGDEVLVWLL